MAAFWASLVSSGHTDSGREHDLLLPTTAPSAEQSSPSLLLSPNRHSLTASNLFTAGTSPTRCHWRRIESRSNVRIDFQDPRAPRYPRQTEKGVRGPGNIHTSIPSCLVLSYCQIKTQLTSGESYKVSTIINYNSRVVHELKIPYITTLEAWFTIIEPLATAISFYLSLVWTDWAILESFWQHISSKKKPRYFWAILNRRKSYWHSDTPTTN